MNTKIYCPQCKGNRSAKVTTAYKCNTCGTVQTESEISKPKEERNLEELFAELCHKQRVTWMKNLFDQCTMKTGEVIISKELAEKIMAEMKVEYSKLSEKAKLSNRQQAVQFLEILNKSQS